MPTSTAPRGASSSKRPPRPTASASSASPSHALRIARFHTLLKEQAKCDDSAQGQARSKQIQDEMEQMGGLQAYQDDSLTGEKVGGETAKWLAKALSQEISKENKEKRAEKRSKAKAGAASGGKKRAAEDEGEGEGQGDGESHPIPTPAKSRKTSNGASASTSSTPRRIASAPSADDAPSTIAKLKASLSSSTDLNALSELLDLVHRLSVSRPSEATSKALLRALTLLTKSFEVLLAEGKLRLGRCDAEGRANHRPETTADEASKQVGEWLVARFNETVVLLAGLLVHGDDHVRASSLRRLMALQVATSSAPSASSSESGALWSPVPWRPLLLALLFGAPQLGLEDSLTNVQRGTQAQVMPDIRELFADEFLETHDDVRFAFCKELASLFNALPPASCAANEATMRSNAVALLFLLTAIPTQQEDLNAFLVPSMAASAPKSKKSRKAANGAKRQKVTEDAASDDEGGEGGASDEDDDDDMEGWFSDSDEEGGAKRAASAGLGKAATSASEGRDKRRRSRKPAAFHAGVHQLGPQRAAFSKAWLSTLLPPLVEDGRKRRPVGGQIPLATTHETLVRLHKQILPHLVKPTLAADWLISCLEAGGATSLLALNGLYTLMVSHNLNYPSFYASLYALLLSPQSPVLHVRYRSRFLRLLDLFLSSTHLPAHLVASFVKRLSRMALRGPPAGIVVVVPFVYNLVRRHKGCLVMIHREFGDRLEAGPAGVQDPYDPLETDPLKTKALASSLWELGAMGATLASSQANGGQGAGAGETHYLGSVSTIARILAEPLSKEKYDLEDFLDLTYGTLFETETKATLNLKKRNATDKPPAVPALAYALPSAPKGAAFEAFATETGRAKLQAAKDKEREENATNGGGVTAAPRASDGAREDGVEGADDEAQDEEEDDDLDDEERQAREAMAEVERLEEEAKRQGLDLKGLGSVSSASQVQIPDLAAELWSF